MSWRVRVRPEAEDDIIEAAAWYENRSDGLGAKFRRNPRSTRRSGT